MRYLPMPIEINLQDCKLATNTLTFKGGSRN